MQFIYPAFLFSLTAVSIPVIIHLFHFRQYKTVYFSNIAFLKNIQQESRSRSNLKQILILICRILAIACLVFAFAQPFIPVNTGKAKQASGKVSIYIDNSFSMDGESKYGRLLDVAKNKAREIASSFPQNIRFLLVTNDFDLKHQRFVNRDKFIDYVSQVAVSPKVKSLSEIIERQEEFLTSEDSSRRGGSVFILSDFQKSFSDVRNIQADTSLFLHFLPLTTQPASNLYIDSIWFETPYRKYRQQEDMSVKIVNASGESYSSIPVKLFINDSLKAPGSFSIQPNSSEIVHLSYMNTQTGILSGKIEIQDYPVTYDNTFFFSYSIAGKINILCLNEQEKNRYISALFRNDEYFSVSDVSGESIRSSEFPNYNVIIVNEMKELSTGLIQELTSFLAGGGTVLFFPHIRGKIESYNYFLSGLKSNFFTGIDSAETKIEKVNYTHDIYRTVFTSTEENANLPEIYSHYIFSLNTRTNERAVLTARNKHVILSEIPHGKGKCFVFTMPLSDRYCNFGTHPLFVPTIYNIALNCQSDPVLYHTIGKDEYIEISGRTVNEYNLFHIRDKSGQFDFIPRHSVSGSGGNILLFIMQNIMQSGQYFVTNNNRILTGAAFNYNRRESALTYTEQSELKEQIKDKGIKNFSLLDVSDQYLQKTLSRIEQGRQLWKLFVILALFFVAAEIVLIRFMK